jgi:SAM-dependent methyltransferase
LPAHFELGSFDAVFCVGNSIAHAAGEAEMVAAFESMRSVLAPGGILVLDSHDWEIVHDAGSRMTIEPRVVDRDDIRCIRTYTWRLPDDFGDPCVLDIVPIFLDGERASLRSYRVQMQPFTRAELKERLAAAGFEAIALDAIPGDDRYTAVARRPHSLA